jgi:protein-S-isoprenylcysteine O-methyltransferase Ste14
MASWPGVARRIRVPLGFLLAVFYLWLAKPTLTSMLVGAALVIPGLAIRTLASGHVQKNEQLTTSGPYAYTRNPLYLGSLLLAVGFAVAGWSWRTGAALVVFFLAIYLPVIRAEEAFLRQRFAGFEDYCRNVPRLFPRLTPFAQNAGSFSWDLYWKHREYNSVLGAAAITVVLVAKLIWMSQ